MGVAMGISPAPSMANLYVTIHETKEILPFLDSVLLYLCRFIDDGFVTWLHDPDPVVENINWALFKSAISSGGLGWLFTKRCK